jgi:hypothetical protein
MLIERKSFEPAPDGEHLVTCVDVVDLGMQTGKYGEKRRLKLVFVVDEQDSEGEAIRVTDFVTASIHRTAKLTPYVKALTGKAPGRSFNTETLIGCSCAVTTEQRTNEDGTVFANITDKRTLRKGERPPLMPIDFKRTEDSNDKTPAPKAKANGSGTPRKVVRNIHNVDDNDVEFPGDATA